MRPTAGPRQIQVIPAGEGSGLGLDSFKTSFFLAWALGGTLPNYLRHMVSRFFHLPRGRFSPSPIPGSTGKAVSLRSATG